MGNRNVTERVKHICYYKFRGHSRREHLFFCHLVKASILFTSRPPLDGATLSVTKQKESLEEEQSSAAAGLEVCDEAADKD